MRDTRRENRWGLVGPHWWGWGHHGVDFWVHDAAIHLGCQEWAWEGCRSALVVVLLWGECVVGGQHAPQPGITAGQEDSQSPRAVGRKKDDF